MKSFAEFMAEQTLDPLYVDVKPDEATKSMLAHMQREFKIPNPYHPDKMHCTLIYSTKPCIRPFIDKKKVYEASFEKFDTFDQRNGKKCLVVKLKSPDLLKRHNDLMAEMGASYDFQEYLPHITLSYDLDAFDLASLGTARIKTVFFSEEKCVALNPLAE